ncbi:MAG: glutamate racemase [Caldiserica bacterium]|nr:MAG: glutamate racemase [Caldisericota bacterium]
MIGVFDSGFGGLTVLNRILEKVDTPFIYFGDTAHLPYGTKSKDAVRRFSMKILEFLLKKNVDIVVVACSTASSFALNDLRKKSKVPVIGMIEPVVERVKKEGFKRIGIIGTPGTINSGAYSESIKKEVSDVKILNKKTPLFVPLVEEGLTDGKITESIVKMYLNGFKNKIDALVLGCTHYPLLKRVIKRILPKVILIDPGEEVADFIKRNFSEVLKNKNRKSIFYVSDDPEKFKKYGRRFFHREIKEVKLSKCTE